MFVYIYIFAWSRNYDYMFSFFEIAILHRNIHMYHEIDLTLSIICRSEYLSACLSLYPNCSDSYWGFAKNPAVFGSHPLNFTTCSGNSGVRNFEFRVQRSNHPSVAWKNSRYIGIPWTNHIKSLSTSRKKHQQISPFFIHYVSGSNQFVFRLASAYASWQQCWVMCVSFGADVFGSRTCPRTSKHKINTYIVSKYKSKYKYKQIYTNKNAHLLIWIQYRYSYMKFTWNHMCVGGAFKPAENTNHCVRKDRDQHNQQFDYFWKQTLRHPTSKPSCDFSVQSFRHWGVSCSNMASEIVQMISVTYCSIQEFPLQEFPIPYLQYT